MRPVGSPASARRMPSPSLIGPYQVWPTHPTLAPKAGTRSLRYSVGRLRYCLSATAEKATAEAQRERKKD